MPDFSPVISLAYMRLLGRPPDAGGLEAYNQAMNSGLTEAQMRESLLRSSEYATKHPDTTRALSAARTKKSSKKKKTSTKKTRKR